MVKRGQTTAMGASEIVQDYPVVPAPFGRALVDPALAGWHGDPGLVAAGQQALAQRVRCNLAALSGEYRPDLELQTA